MRTFGIEVAHILAEVSPYLLLGFALSGLLHVVTERRPNLLDPIRGRGPGAVLRATLVGLPLPLCSCSVLPTALALRRKGAGPGATTSFMITVPETDIVSVALTFGLLGPVMAVLRPLASLITGIVTGLAVDAVDRGEPPPAVPTPPLETCDCAGDCHDAAHDAAPWWRRAWRFGFAEFFDDILPSLLAGLLIGAAIAALLPRLDPTLLSDRPLLVYAVMTLLGVPMYVCASASTPIAAGLIAGGVSPGAALVFLLVGPATNAAGMLVLRREFGRGVFAVYLGGIVLISLAMGLLLDALLGATGWVVRALAGAAESGPTIPQYLAAGLFVILSLVSLNRSRPWRRWFGARAGD
ncbi:permease [bacterium]|nr:permease [bacterium]